MVIRLISISRTVARRKLSKLLAMGFVLFSIVLLPLRAKYIRAHTRLADFWTVLRRRSEASPTDFTRYLHRRLHPSLVSYANYTKKQIQQGRFEGLE